MLYWTHCPIIAIYWINCPMIRERLAKTSKLAYLSNFIKIAAYSLHRTILVGKNTVPGRFYFSGTLVVTLYIKAYSLLCILEQLVLILVYNTVVVLIESGD